MLKPTLLLLSLIGSATADFSIVAHLKQRNLSAFESLFWDIATPGTAEYLSHKSLEEIASVIGASDSELSTVTQWLEKAGGYDVTVSSLKDSVSARFGDKTHSLTLAEHGVPHKASHPKAVEFIVRRDDLKQEEGLDHPIEAAVARHLVANGDEAYTIDNIKKAYGIPNDLQATHDETLQMVWGPGTFGYSPAKLAIQKKTEAPLINMEKILWDTENHGESGGDNFYEGQLDVNMISSFGLNVTTLVSNTNTSASTEETTGFGAALLDFITELSSRETVPHVLSMSLGSLSAASCDLLCSEVVKLGFTQEECDDYISEQRQVCMYLSEDQTARINTAFQVLGTRGTTIMGSSGDGGSHFSFGPFQGGEIADALNTVSCAFQIPVFPTGSPYVLSIGGEMWDGDSDHPITWAGFGGGSGSGFSIQFDAPEHQKKTVAEYLTKDGMPPSGSFDASKRAYPDISAVGVQGTSQSCPITAGIFSLIIDARLNAGLPPLGFAGPRIYSVAEQYPGEAFSDIIGGNSCTSCDNGFPATEGWDADTGFGRPVWDGLMKHFANDDDLSVA
jgi:hypothetical protein